MNFEPINHFSMHAEETPSVCRLSFHEVIIWEVSTDHFHSLHTNFKTVLSEEEIMRAGRFHQANDARRFLTGTIALRLLLSAYLNIDAADINFQKGKYGKPYLANDLLPIHFNLSHSGNFILIAFSLTALGIDIEEMNPNFNFTPLLDVFNKEEKAYLYQNQVNTTKRFYLLWTRKECLLKQNGMGIHETMNTYSVIKNKSIRTTTGISETTPQVEIRSFLLPKHPNYIASICYEDNVKSFYYYTFTLSMFKTKT